MYNKWTIIKCLAAHTFGDWGAQTSVMAMHKNDDAMIRTEHVAMVGLSFGVALLTDDKLSWPEKFLVIATNVIFHWLIDTFRLHKAIDRALHAGVAIGSVLAVSHE